MLQQFDDPASRQSLKMDALVRDAVFGNEDAYLRFDMEKRPLMWQWTRRFWQLVQSHSANNKWL